MKVGEDGLVPRTGAEFMALETTADAGTCLACRSMLGLVGSSERMEGTVGEGGRQLSLRVPHPQTGLRARPESPKPLNSPAFCWQHTHGRGYPTNRAVVWRLGPASPRHTRAPGKGPSQPS